MHIRQEANNERHLEHLQAPADQQEETASMDRGSKFYAPTGETTEWEDILVKKGILAPKTKVQEEESESEDEQRDPRQDATLDELDEMDVRPVAFYVCVIPMCWVTRR